MTLSSWIAKAVVQHDERHGANLNAEVDGGSRIVQIKAFHTYRTADNPRAKITGVVSDKTHDIPVEFDIDATDRYESTDGGLPTESLTSNLRAFLAIRTFKWKLESPRPAAGRDVLELPVIKMEILEFDVRAGNREWPSHAEDAVPLGRGKGDGEIQRVLRKWYLGESHSDPSQADVSFDFSQPESGPSRSSGQRRAGPPHPPGVISLSDFLEPYISEGGAKKGKQIPDWIFDLPDENRRSLAEVKVFGLELNDASGSSPLRSGEVIYDRPTQPPLSKDTSLKRIDKGKQRAEPDGDTPVEWSGRPQPSASATQYDTPPVPLGQRPQSTQTVTQPTHDSQAADDEESDGDIPIKSLTQGPQRKKRPIFDPLAFSSQGSQPETSAVEQDRAGLREEPEQGQSGDETTDSDLLSDYERSARREKKRRRPDTLNFDHERHGAEAQAGDESIPASESLESYSLSKQFPSPPKRDAGSESRVQQSLVGEHDVVSSVLVDHGAPPTSNKDPDSLESKNTGSGSLPTPPPSDHHAGSSPSSQVRAAQELPRVDPKSEAVDHASPARRPARDIAHQTTITSAVHVRDSRLALDITVDGLSETKLRDHIRKMREKRR